MAWMRREDAPAAMLCWEATLTVEAEAPGPLPIGLVSTPTVQVAGDFGPAVLEIGVSNGGPPVRVDALRHTDLIAVVPAAWLHVTVRGADETTALIVTVAGRR